MRYHALALCLLAGCTFSVAEAAQDDKAAVAVRELVDYVRTLNARQHETIIGPSREWSKEDRKRLDRISSLTASIRRVGQEATPALKSQLQRAQSKWEKFWLLNVMADTRDPSALSLFDTYAHHDDGDLHRKAIRGLSMLGLPAAKSLQEIAEDSEAPSRVRAMRALYKVAKIAATSSPERLEDILGSGVRMLDDKDPDVRVIALHIVSLGDRSYTGHLVPFLEDKNKTVRSETVDLLAKRDDTAAIRPLMEYLLQTERREFRARHRIALAVARLARVKLPPLELSYRDYGVLDISGEGKQIQHILTWWEQEGSTKYPKTDAQSIDAEPDAPAEADKPRR